MFLKDGHAESYERVVVAYFIGHHEKPTLSIIDADDNEIENIELDSFRSVQELHDLFCSKGFERKPQEEVEALLKERREKKEVTKRTRVEYLRKLKEKRTRGGV
eukprot:scaffold11571_cov122-Cylindrotheca_fusiformis.AAC.19